MIKCDPQDTTVDEQELYNHQVNKAMVRDAPTWKPVADINDHNWCCCNKLQQGAKMIAPLFHHPEGMQYHSTGSLLCPKINTCFLHTCWRMECLTLEGRPSKQGAREEEAWSAVTTLATRAQPEIGPTTARGNSSH